MSMNHDYETGVALSDYVNKTFVKYPLVEKSWWRHFWLALKPRYLGNHASKYGTLSRSHGCSFRIRHEKPPEAPLGGEITMTSYPACNKSSLSRKPCFPIKIYYGMLWGSHGRSFRIHRGISLETLPSGEITMTSYPVCNKTSSSLKPCIPGEKLLWNAIRKSRSLFHNPSWNIAWSAPRWRNHDDVISGLQYNLIISETMQLR